jgi:predicted dehydrogenase
MPSRVASEPLGVGLVGSGFISGFHVDSWRGVRHSDITGIFGRNETTARALADRCRATNVGDPFITSDLVELVRDPRVDAIWVGVPNFLRLEVIETICDEVRSGRAELKGVAIEKPLAPTRCSRQD